MKSIFKSKCNDRKQKSLSKILSFTLVFIFLVTFFLLHFFQENISGPIIQISEAEIKKITYRFITDRINHHLINKETVQDILILTKNKDDEILYVDFNWDKAYLVLDEVSHVLTTSFQELEKGNIEMLYYDRELSNKTNSITLSIPIGSVFRSPYFTNFGPKIPVNVNFVGSVLTNLETKITNYGLNNAFVEVFVYIEFSSEIITAHERKTIHLKYDAVIASMMVHGQVPNFYNGEIKKESQTIVGDLK